MFFLLLLFPPAPVRDAQCVKTKSDTGLFARHHQFFCFSCFLSSPCGWCTAWQLILIQNRLFIITRFFFVGYFLSSSHVWAGWCFLVFFPAPRGDFFGFFSSPQGWFLGLFFQPPGVIFLGVFSSPQGWCTVFFPAPRSDFLGVFSSPQGWFFFVFSSPQGWFFWCFF